MYIEPPQSKTVHFERGSHLRFQLSCHIANFPPVFVSRDTNIDKYIRSTSSRMHMRNS